MTLRLCFFARPSVTHVVLCTGALALVGCAHTPRAVDPSGAVRRSVPELAALRPALMQAALTSSVGERAVFDQEIATIQAAFALPPGPQADEKVPPALAAAAHFNVMLDAAKEKLLALLPTASEKSPAYQRGLLSVAHALFAREVAPLLPELMPHLRTPREFAIAAYTLLQVNDDAAQRESIARLMRTNFAHWSVEPRLRALARRLQVHPREELRQRPPLVDLLTGAAQSGYPVVFSFQRNAREYGGLALVRGADGRFVRNPDGSYFSITQLAMARSNLPGTITNGNTPQGVFVIRGTGTATNRWIGPTPYLESMLPVEAPVALFEQPELREISADAAAAAAADAADAAAAAAAEARKAQWSEGQYARWLPPAWRHYFPMQEAFLAGHAGRDEILAHGNTVNPAYYRGERFFPYAPSAGCLVAMEYWSKDDGTLVHSDQLALVKAFVSTGFDVGYLVVVELDDERRPVLLADVIEAVVAAEQTR